MKGESNQLTGITNCGPVYFNLPVPALVQKALERGEGTLTSSGALRVNTGKYTGRSPHDKFIVDTVSVHQQIWWDANKAISTEKYAALRARLLAYLQHRELFVFDGFVGADAGYRLPLRAINEFAWQNLFVHQLFLRPTAEELAEHQPEFTLICAPGFNADPEIDSTNSEAFIILNFDEREIIIGGTCYAGEMKKSIFTVMNYLLPQKNVLPMHCSANVGAKGDAALFFGLSGTGKTTLSADPERELVGDDEHGWTENGVFNFEGGCYAKCINLKREKEPQIWDAIKFGTVLENVILDENGAMDFDDDSLTENTRAGYPIDYIPNAVIPGIGGIPETVVFLTADAFGVLPPIARLNKEQAMYHFLSGYTSKLAGTERGINEPQATFSTCFGAPFMPLPPIRYAQLLGEKINRYNSRVFLINTGWTGGQYGVGRRMNLEYTRAMVSAALQGELDDVNYIYDPIFNIAIPKSCPGVPEQILNPRSTWKDKNAYDLQAKKLAERFQDNFSNFAGVPEEVLSAGPQYKDKAV